MELQELLGEDASRYEKIIQDFLDERIIIINQTIDSSILEDVNLYIIKWNKEDSDKPAEVRKPIHIYFSSNGGDVVSGLNTIDVIKSSKTKVVGVVFSCAASMAGYILMACHERVAWKNSVILVHDGTQGICASAGKAKDTMRFYENLDGVVKDLVLSSTCISEEDYDSNIDREQYMLAEEAKSKGIIDKIIGVDVDMDYIL